MKDETNSTPNEVKIDMNTPLATESVMNIPSKTVIISPCVSEADLPMEKTEPEKESLPHVSPDNSNPGKKSFHKSIDAKSISPIANVSADEMTDSDTPNKEKKVLSNTAKYKKLKRL